jgi:hypothetical protein
MITISTSSVSDELSLEEAIARLKLAPLVDGIAEFGSRTTNQANVSSDYDLLVLVKAIPARVFQMVTTIGGRLADIVLVEIETADDLLATTGQPKPRSFEALFAQKMQTARILYDPSERLHKVKQRVTSEASKTQPSMPEDDSDLYAAWFWQSFGLLHLERMAQSQDLTRLSAVDMMLTSCLAGTWRSYFDVRRITWEGEKAAIRYWAKHDQEYLQTVNRFLFHNAFCFQVANANHCPSCHAPRDTHCWPDIPNVGSFPLSA